MSLRHLLLGRIGRHEKLSDLRGGLPALEIAEPPPFANAPAGRERVWKLERSGPSGFRLVCRAQRFEVSSERSFQAIADEFLEEGRLFISSRDQQVLRRFAARLREEDFPLERVCVDSGDMTEAPALAELPSLTERVLRLPLTLAEGSKLEVRGPAHGVGFLAGNFEEIDDLCIEGHVWLWTTTKWSNALKVESRHALKLWSWNTTIEMWTFNLMGGT